MYAGNGARLGVIWARGEEIRERGSLGDEFNRGKDEIVNGGAFPRAAGEVASGGTSGRRGGVKGRQQRRLCWRQRSRRDAWS